MVQALEAFGRARGADFGKLVLGDLFPVIYLYEGDEYQQQLAALLLDMHRLPKLLTVVTTDLFCFSERFGMFTLSATAPTGSKHFTSKYICDVGIPCSSGGGMYRYIVYGYENA